MRWPTVIDGQPGEHVDGGLEQLEVEDPGALGEHQADRQDHDAHGAVGDARPCTRRRAPRRGRGCRRPSARRARRRRRRRPRRRCRPAENWTATAVSTMPSSMRSSVESRNAPKLRALARHARVAAVERVADRADDERDAAEEVVLAEHEHGGDDAQREAGERDRVRRQARLDEPVAHQRLVLARRRAGARVRAAGRACGAGNARRPAARRPRAAGAHAQAAGRARAKHDGRDGRRRRPRAAPGKASNQQWLAVATTTKRDEQRVRAPERLRPQRGATIARHRHAEHQRERDVHRRHRGERVEERVGRRAVRRQPGEVARPSP